MKKISEAAVGGLKAVILFYMVWFCMSETAVVKSAVSGALSRCTEILIPSLFAMMTVSAMLIKSGAAGCLPKFFQRLTEKLLGMNGRSFVIFLVSQIAGYPTGVGMIMAEFRNGRLSKRSAELLSGVCFGAGTAFIFGCISQSLYGGSVAGKIILVSVLAANLAVTLIVSFFLRREKSQNEERTALDFSGEVITESVLSGGRAISGVCFMTIIFSVFTAMLDKIGVVSAASGIISSVTGCGRSESSAIAAAFLDVTAISGLPFGNYTLLPIICTLTSFGGICVMLQISSITKGEISLLLMICIRGAAAILSGVICRGIMPYMLKNEAVSAAAGIKLHHEASPLPSVMIMMMTLILMYEYGERKNEKISK